MRRLDLPLIVLFIQSLTASVEAEPVALGTLPKFPPATQGATAYSVSSADDSIIVSKAGASATQRIWSRATVAGDATVILEEGKTLAPTSDGAPLTTLSASGPTASVGLNDLPFAAKTSGAVLAREKNAFCLIDSEIHVVWHLGDKVTGAPDSFVLEDVTVPALAEGLEVNYWPHPHALFLNGKFSDSSTDKIGAAALTWTEGAGLRLVALPGDEAPGVPLQFFVSGLGSPFASVLDGSPLQALSMTPDGHGLFHGTYTGAAAAADRSGYWYGTKRDDLKLLLGHETALGPIEKPSAFLYGQLFADGSAVLAQNQELIGVWAGPLEHPESVAVVGDQVKGLPDGFVYQLPSLRRYADDKAFVFSSGVAAKDGPTRYGLWVMVGDHSHLIAFQDEPLPGEPDTLATPALIDSEIVAINLHGQFVLLTTENGPALHRYSPGTGFELIAKGDSVVSDENAQMRAIVNIYGYVKANPNTHPDVFIDSKGRVVFNAVFSDKTFGVVVSNPRESGEFVDYKPAKLAGAAGGGESRPAQNSANTGAAGGRSNAGAGASRSTAGAGGTRSQASSASSESDAGQSDALTKTSKEDAAGGCAVARVHDSGSRAAVLLLLGLGVMVGRRRGRTRCRT